MGQVLKDIRKKCFLCKLMWSLPLLISDTSYRQAAILKFTYSEEIHDMLKPLSQKTLEKKYSELGLSKAKTDLLHTYFRCFSNLYGVITVREAWDIFRHYEGTAIRKKDFAAFSSIVQREAGHPYSVYEMKEIFSGEETDDPLDRMIVNNKLVLSGYNRFIYVYATVERQRDKPYYLPDKEAFLTFTDDLFYLTPCGKAMRTFIENLKTSGINKNFSGKPIGKITDLNGRPVKGKRLSDCIFYTYNEVADIDYTKSEVKKQKLREEFSITSAEKVLRRIQENIMTGGIFRNDTPAHDLKFLIKFLDDDFGVDLSREQVERFVELYMNLNNSSNLWLNCGWSPEDLFRFSSVHF